MTRADFKRLSEVAAANRSILNFFFIEGGAPLSEAYTLVGIPDSVSEETIYQDVVRGLIDVNVAHNRIVLNYKGAGSLRFERTDLNGENWQLISVIYDFDLENAEPAIRAAAISQVVSITNLREQLKAIETIARIEIKDRESLDAIAQGVGDLASRDDPFSAQGGSHLCKVLGRSGDGRYKPFLKDIAENGERMKLRGYADDQVDILPDTAEFPFVYVKGKMGSKPVPIENLQLPQIWISKEVVKKVSQGETVEQEVYSSHHRLDTASRLQELNNLKQQGLITGDEYEQKRAKILDGL